MIFQCVCVWGGGGVVPCPHFGPPHVGRFLLFFYGFRMNHRFRSTPMSVGFAYGNTKFQEKPDGYAHVCADGHKHSTKEEVQDCIDAHRVFVCSEAHFHTLQDDAKRCDEIKRWLL